eukprot:gene43588-54149_t
MLSPSTLAAPESLHPSLWLASQLAHSATRCVDTGYAALSAQLPGGGWRTSHRPAASTRKSLSTSAPTR